MTPNPGQYFGTGVFVIVIELIKKSCQDEVVFSRLTAFRVLLMCFQHNRKSAPASARSRSNCAIGESLPLSLSIKKPHRWWSFFMERETRLELATSSLARKHSTTELPPHFFAVFLLYMSNFFLQVFFLRTYVANSTKNG